MDGDAPPATSITYQADAVLLDIWKKAKRRGCCVRTMPADRPLPPPSAVLRNFVPAATCVLSYWRSAEHEMIMPKKPAEEVLRDIVCVKHVDDVLLALRTCTGDELVAKLQGVPLALHYCSGAQVVAKFQQVRGAAVGPERQQQHRVLLGGEGGSRQVLHAGTARLGPA